QLKKIYSEMEWQLGEKAYEPFNFYYDLFLSQGELISSTIIQACLKENKIKSQWLDVRTVLKTDDTHRDAKIDWKLSQELVQTKVAPMLDDYPILITQGFLASSPEGNTTTLGREGSDFSA